MTAFVRAPETEATRPDDGHRVITILSPKGGAGKTTVATNLAVGLAKRYPRQVCLVDVDLQFGDVAGALRIAPESTFLDVARRWPLDAASLKLQLESHHEGLFALCAPENPAQADEVHPAHVESVLPVLARAFRFVIVDTDPGLSERALSALDCSTDAILVCATDVPTVRGLRKAIEALDYIGLTGTTRHYVLNRADAKVNLSADEVEQTIGQSIDVRVDNSPDVVLSTNSGVPIMEAGTNQALVRSFQQLCDRFEAGPTSAGTPQARGGLFRRRG